MKNKLEGKSFLVQVPQLKDGKIDENNKMLIEFVVDEGYDENSFLAKTKYGNYSRIFRTDEVYKWLRK